MTLLNVAQASEQTSFMNETNIDQTKVYSSSMRPLVGQEVSQSVQQSAFTVDADRASPLKLGVIKRGSDHTVDQTSTRIIKSSSKDELSSENNKSCCFRLCNRHNRSKVTQATISFKDMTPQQKKERARYLWRRAKFLVQQRNFIQR